ncbi:MAG: hypothetical protein WB987_08985 [Candidatus Acidiferrales bacterium]
MIQLLLFIAVGAGLLVLLLLVMRRSPTAAEGSAAALVAAKHSLRALQTGLLATELVDRVFGKQDTEYVSSIGSNELQNLFVGERKRLALEWIGQVRRQIRELKEFHTRRSRMFAQMSRWTELSLAVEFASLQSECMVLHLVVRWRGPYAAPHLVRRTTSTAAGLCAVLDRSLAFLTPSLPVGLGRDSGTDRTAI